MRLINNVRLKTGDLFSYKYIFTIFSRYLNPMIFPSILDSENIPFSKPFLSLLFSLTVTTATCQNMESEVYFYNWFDNITGISNLYNGAKYVENHIATLQDHKFFKEYAFMSGSLQYEGQIYSNLKLRYNVYEEQLLLECYDNSGVTELVLDYDKIHSFILEHHKFTPIRDQEELKGFFEVILDNHVFVLLKKHRKKINKKSDKSFVYYVFDNKHDYYIHYKNEYYRIKKARNLVAVFPDFKNEIIQSVKENKATEKAHPDTFIEFILKGLQPFILINKPTAK